MEKFLDIKVLRYHSQVELFMMWPPKTWAELHATNLVLMLTFGLIPTHVVRAFYSFSLMSS